MNRFLLLIVSGLAFSSCTTIENRRDLYTHEKVNGPYTRLLAERRWKSLSTPPKKTAIPPQSPTPSDGKTVKSVL